MTGDNTTERYDAFIGMVEFIITLRPDPSASDKDIKRMANVLGYAIGLMASVMLDKAERQRFKIWCMEKDSVLEKERLKGME